MYLKMQIIHGNLDNEYFDIMNLRALSNLLIEKTSEYFEILQQKNVDGFKVRDLKLQMDTIQETIKLRKPEK
jgi:hypothetical protein